MDEQEAKQEADLQAQESQPESAPEEVSVEDALEQLVAGDEESPATEEDSDDTADEESEDEHADNDDEGDDSGRKVSTNTQKRIDTLVAQRNEERTKNEQLESKLSELESKAAENLSLDPSYLTKDQVKLIKEADAVESREAWLLDHIDGYEHPSDDAKCLTASDVRKELSKVRQQAKAISGKANTVYEQAKSKMLDDIALGRLVREKGFSVANGKLVMSKSKKPKATKKSPRDPVNIKPSNASPTVETSTRSNKRGMSEERFLKSGGDRAAAERELAELIPD